MLGHTHTGREVETKFLKELGHSVLVKGKARRFPGLWVGRGVGEEAVEMRWGRGGWGVVIEGG